MTKTVTPGPAAIAAAVWWAEQVGAPTFRNVDSSDTLESQRIGGIAGMFASLIADRHPVKEGQAPKFVTALSERIEQRFTPKYGVTLSVDYGPDGDLAHAAAAAGISASRFPWKTVMWIYSDHVVVSAGYRGQPALVWGSDEWLTNRPVCEAQSYDEAKANELGWRNYHGEPVVCSLPKYHDEAHRYDQPAELCAVCGRLDDPYHDAEQRGHMADFHEFEVAS